ncbi:MAG: hypothetical protein WDN09_02275 [bacterium]
MKLRVYFACALTHSPPDFQQKIASVKECLKALPDVELLDFVGLVDGSPQDVYEHDIHTCVKSADLIIADCTHPAIGLGWELGAATEAFRKHVFIVAADGSHLSRLIHGAVSPRNSDLAFATYGSQHDLFMICKERIEYVQVRISNYAE